MFCPNCGTSIQPGAKFCYMCGRAMPVEPEADSVIVDGGITADDLLSDPDNATVSFPAPVSENESADEPAVEQVPEAADENDIDNQTQAYFQATNLDSTLAFTSDSQNAAVAVEENVQPAGEPLDNKAPAVTDTGFDSAYNNPIGANSDSSEFYGNPYNFAEAQDQFDAAETPVVAKKRVPLAVVIILSVLFGVLIFSFGLYAAFAQSVQSTLSNNMISKQVATSNPLDVQIGDLLLSDEFEDDFEDLLEDYNNDIDDIDESTTVSEFILLISKTDRLNKKDLKEIVEDTSILPYVAKVVASYENYILTGEGEEVVSADEISDLIDDNIDDIEDIMDAELKLNEDKLKEGLEDNEDMLEDINPENALGDLGKVTSTALSPVVIIAAAALALIFTILLGIICKSVSASMMTFGICATFIGITMVSLCIAKDIVVDKIGVSYAVIDDFLFGMLDASLFAQIRKIGLVTLAAGIAFIAISIVIINVKKASARKKAKTA